MELTVEHISRELKLLEIGISSQDVINDIYNKLKGKLLKEKGNFLEIVDSKNGFVLARINRKRSSVWINRKIFNLLFKSYPDGKANMNFGEALDICGYIICQKFNIFDSNTYPKSYPLHNN